MKTPGARVSTRSSPKSKFKTPTGVSGTRSSRGIGGGVGMGVIFRAPTPFPPYRCCKRVLDQADSRETLAHFRREAQAAANIDHPNVLPIHEVSDNEDGLPFFSMKFASGGSLQEASPALRDEPRQCAALIAKVERAVQYAHARAVFIERLEAGKHPARRSRRTLVSDFGLAKWFDTMSDLTRTPASHERFDFAAQRYVFVVWRTRVNPPRRHKNHPRFPERNPSHEKIFRPGAAGCLHRLFLRKILPSGSLWRV
jgi:serine/threonine protein kinase